MKVRILYVQPHERHLKIGGVYDLADGKSFVDAREAEKVDAKADADPDPRPQPEEPAAEGEQA